MQLNEASCQYISIWDFIFFSVFVMRCWMLVYCQKSKKRVLCFCQPNSEVAETLYYAFCALAFATRMCRDKLSWICHKANAKNIEFVLKFVTKLLLTADVMRNRSGVVGIAKVQRPGLEVNQSSSCIFKVKNDCNYTSPSHICLYGVHEERFVDVMNGKQTAK